MSTSQSQKKEAIAQAAEQELTSLAVRGVRIAGNACSPIVLVKGDLDEAERSGGELAAGPDGAAQGAWGHRLRARGFLRAGKRRRRG